MNFQKLLIQKISKKSCQLIFYIYVTYGLLFKSQRHDKPIIKIVF